MRVIFPGLPGSRIGHESLSILRKSRPFACSSLQLNIQAKDGKRRHVTENPVASEKNGRQVTHQAQARFQPQEGCKTGSTRPRSTPNAYAKSRSRPPVRPASQSKTRPPAAVPRATVKRKVALYFGYDGAKYHGLQRNIGVSTISDVMERALQAAGAISDENLGYLEKIKWTVAARTDKGVSAAGNVASLKAQFLREECDDPSSLVKLKHRINNHLPSQVRVFGVSRVTSSFSARLSCEGRNYEYLLPVLALSHGDTLNRFNKLLRMFEGSHPFHNYTVGADHAIPPRAQAFRTMHSVCCDSNPVTLITKDAHGKRCSADWVRIRFRGQSFMMHQIRKMVSMALLVHNGELPDDAILRSLSKSCLIDVPPVPTIGLFLDLCNFGWYNEQYGNHLAEPVSCASFKDELETFKRNIILPSIAEQSLADRSMNIYFEVAAKYKPMFETECIQGVRGNS